MSEAETITEPRACRECKKEFAAPGAMVLDRFIAYRKFCPDCLPAVEARQRQDRDDLARRQLEARWLTICTDEFSTVDRNRLPDTELFDRVQSWQFGPRGLVVAGETGMGKSRACWALLRREFFAGHSVAALSAYDLARWPARVLHDSQQADIQLERMVRVGILYLDDPFKSRLTPTVEELLFVALDERAARRRPCIFSFNDTATTILERLSSDRGKAFLRRIKDFCDVVRPKTGAEK